MELREGPGAFSELIGLPVVSNSGRSIVRAFEVRAHWDGDGKLELDAVLVGRGALWRRLRGPASAAHGIPWQEISEVSSERIVVHDR